MRAPYLRAASYAGLARRDKRQRRVRRDDGTAGIKGRSSAMRQGTRVRARAVSP